MKLIPFLLGACTLGLAACHPRGSAPAPAVAPAWKLRDLAGNLVSSDQFKGKVVILDFWATWCGPCTRELPDLIKLQKKYADEGLVIVGLAMDEQGLSPQKAPTVVKRYVEKHQIVFPVVLANDQVQADYGGGLDAIPTAFIIDRDGFIRDKQVGIISPAQFEQRLLKVLR